MGGREGQSMINTIPEFKENTISSKNPSNDNLDYLGPFKRSSSSKTAA